MSHDPKAKRNSRVTGEKRSSYERFEHGDFALEYLRFGEGPRPLLAFHGFGRRAEDLALFAPYLNGDITLYSFNLFGHGRSVYPPERLERNTISKKEFAGMIEAFLDDIGAEKAVLMGYSLGGKLALSLIEHLPERLDGVYLFAPDGLTRFHWYPWASRIPIVRRIFRHFIHHPKGLFWSFSSLASLGFIHKRTSAFLQHQARTVEQRKAVHAIWNMHRDLGPNLSKVRMMLRVHEIPIRLIFGKRDPVITSRRGWKLLDPKTEADKVYLLPKGHILLDQKTVEFLALSGDFDDPSNIF